MKKNSNMGNVGLFAISNLLKRNLLRYVVTAALAAALLPTVHGALFNWTTQWTPMTVNGGTQYYHDPNDINPASVDLLGNASGPACAFWALHDNHIQFRLAMSGTSQNPQAVWQVFFDTDGNENTLEYVLQLDLKVDNRVEFAKVTGGPTLEQVSVGTETTDILWTGARADYANVFPANASYIDLAIPYSTFVAFTGTSSARLLFTTSADHNNINKDYPLGLSSSDLINAGLSDNVAIPEPSTGLAVGGLMLLLALGKKLRSQPSQR
ncbi:MAG: hypothetical protein GX456_19650 [Verrucomicrobia bacterium]|nr:hypothetical protein [Verrucomicrobiota bacterium]